MRCTWFRVVFLTLFGVAVYLTPGPWLLTSVFAQSTTANLSGTVVDERGAVVPDVRITVSNLETGLKRQATTNNDGLFTIPLLPPGTYTLRAQREGFTPVEVPQIDLPVGGRLSLGINLKVGNIGETVDVSARTPLIQPYTSALSEVVDNRQVELLPINGRDFRHLSTLVPGAAPRSPRDSFGSFTVNGQREKTNIFLIDGVDNNDPFRNQPSFNQGGVTTAPATLLPLDAIDEFSLETHGPAEYGRNSGAVVNIVIKSGTNVFRGSVYNFLRNDNFDARNFFETRPGARKGEFKNNNFGGVIGGPIVRNRTFFFTGYEGQRERVTSTFEVTVPSSANLTAARAMNTAAGRAENLLSTQLLSLFPIENLPGRNNNYVFSVPNRNDSDNFLVKLEHRFSERFNLSGRYIFGDGHQAFPLTSGFGSPLPAYQTVVSTRVQLVGLNTVQILTPTLINEIRVSYNRYAQGFTPLDVNFDPASIGLITSARGLPTITIAGFVSLGAPTTVPRGRVSRTTQLVDNLTWIHGAHTFKIGGEYRRIMVNSSNNAFARGRINFTNPAGAIASLADFLAGRPSPSGTTIARGITERDTFSNDIGLFIQNDWRVSSSLTLNLGLRYEYIGVFSEEENRIASFIPGRGLVRVGQADLPTLYQPDRNNFAPRFGFAYDVAGKGKTVVRAAYGWYYDTPSQDFFLQQGFSPGSVGTNPIPELGTFNVTFPSTATVPFGPNVPIFNTVPAPPFALFAVDQNLRAPYIQSYNLNIQHSLREGTVLQVSYVGSRGTKLFRLRDINQATPGPVETRQLRRPYNAQFPQFSFINYLETSANSHYNSLQTYLKQRLTKGLSFYLSYTWSKSIDDASNGIFAGTRGTAFPQDSHNLKAERALSSFDRRRRLTANFVCDLGFLPRLLARLPKQLTEGWRLSGIYTLASGSPITPFLSVDQSGTGEFNDRPNLIGNPNSGSRRVDAFFNTAAFALPAPGTFGNAGRNIIIGPRVHIADISINKQTKITEQISLQFRAEIFNLFNRPNFSLPNVDFNSLAFGTISETPDVSAGNPRLGEGGPRVMQFGIKLVF